MSQTKMNLFALVAAITLALTAAQNASADIETFDDNALAANSHWGGTASGETGFTSGDAYFPHSSDDWAWDGFVYSNETDNTTAGYGNQYSAITGGGVKGSSNYALGYIPTEWWASGDHIAQTVSFGALTGNDYNTTISGAYFTNTTYAYYSMRDGDAFATKMGGATGDDADYAKIIIKGIDAGANYTGTVEFYLADYRFTDNSQDYIVDAWTWVDLTSLGNVVGLEFDIELSRSGYPMYFAMDSLNSVPEPATIGLLTIGIATLLRRRKA